MIVIDSYDCFSKIVTNSAKLKWQRYLSASGRAVIDFWSSHFYGVWFAFYERKEVVVFCWQLEVFVDSGLFFSIYAIRAYLFFPVNFCQLIYMNHRDNKGILGEILWRCWPSKEEVIMFWW